MKLALLQTADSQTFESPSQKFYPFKSFNPYRDIIKPKVEPADQFEREVKEFQKNKKIQVLQDLADLMPGASELPRERDHGVTTFHRILSHYDRDLLFKPSEKRVQLLDSMPDKLAAYSMLGFGKDKDPQLYEMFTRDNVRIVPKDKTDVIPVAERNCINDILAQNTGDFGQSRMTFKQDPMELPTQADYYPGVADLAGQPSALDEEATKIQKVFRGNFSRKNIVDLTDPEKRALALKKYYDPHKYSDPINRLRFLQINEKELKLEQDKNQLKQVVDHREKFLKSDVRDLVMIAKRDPFTDAEIQHEAKQSRIDHHIDKLRNSEVQHGLKLDQLQWDVEESKFSPQFSGNRQKARRKSSRPTHGNNRGNLSNTDLGYSDEIEFDIQGTGYSTSSMVQESVQNESFIDDLAQSRAMSKSRSRGNLRDKRMKGYHSSREELSIPDESMGFGFLKNEGGKKDDGLKRKFSQTEGDASDSNPFGFIQKKPEPIVANQGKKEEFSSPEANQKNLRISSPSIKPFSRELKSDSQEISVAQKGGAFKSGLLDERIYSPVIPSDPYKPPKKEIYKANGSTSQAIQSKLSDIFGDLKVNSNLLKEMKDTVENNTKKYPRLDQEAEQRIEENEILLKKLLNKVTLAREEINRPDRLESILTGQLAKQVERNLPQRPLSNQDARGKISLADFNFDTHTFDQLFAKAAMSSQNLRSMDDAKYELTVRQLEDRIRRLEYAEEDLEEAILRHRKEIEFSNEEIKERFNRAIEQKRAARDLFFSRGTRAPDQPTGKNQFEAGRGQKAGQISDGQKLAYQGNKSKTRFETVNEESQYSGTQVSDYSESKEQLENISWIDLTDMKQKKFTNFN